MLKNFDKVPKTFGRLQECILKLRKECNLSQEQLGEKINVTRQTISNWELGETQPNPEQLTLLSKTLNVSVDELLSNDIKPILVEKVSNTEKLAGLIIKILKGIGVLLLIYFVFIILALILYNVPKKSITVEKETQTVHLECSLDGKNYNYLIESDKDDKIIDTSGSDYIINIVKDKEFTKGKILVEYIESHFKDNGGSCK